MIRHLVKRLGRGVGVEMSRYRPFGARRAARLFDFQVDTVIDVGASRGEYGAELRTFGYKGTIISLEPVPAAFTELAKRTALDGAWTCLNVAAGDRDGEGVINIASNLASSSLLTMGDDHRHGAPEVTTVGRERTRVRRLDSLGLDIVAPALLKLDVQGYEAQVLSGASNMLAGVALIECELSLARLYKGQPSFRTMIDNIYELGFEMVDLEPIFFARHDGRVLAIDGMFSRTPRNSS